MKLSVTFINTLLASLMVTAALTRFLPDEIPIRFGWASLLFPLLWPILIFFCYWFEKVWRSNAVLFGLTLALAGAVFLI